jgi:hypothetical protein
MNDTETRPLSRRVLTTLLWAILVTAVLICAALVWVFTVPLQPGDGFG